MRSNFPNIQIVALFVLLIAACQPQATTDVVTTDVAATTISTEEESAGCKRIIYAYGRLGRTGFESNIVSMCLDGTEKGLLTTDNFGNVAPSWSPDGARIAFLSVRSGTRQLHIMDPDGGNIRQITFGPDTVDWHWFWLPDGDQIVVLISSGDGGEGGGDSEGGADGEGEEDDERIVEVERHWQIVNVVTNEITLLTDWSDDIFFQYPAFSHDGARLAFVTRSEYVEGIQSTAQIHIQNIDGSNAYTLISDIWTRGNPVWSYDDSQLAFLLDLAGNDDQFVLYTVNVDGSNLQRVTNSVFSQPVSITWSPDGESLLIYDDETLSILELDSGQIIKLFTVEYPAYISGTSWQP